MTRSGAVSVSNADLVSHAERLLSQPVELGDLALDFEPSSAASAELLVAGDSFYPRMLDDIAEASSSVHVNQFGFKQGEIGERFASALIAKAAAGVTVRVIVDRRGSATDDRSHEMYERLAAAGVTVCVVRAMQARAQHGPIGTAGVKQWNLHGLGHFDHRKLLVVDGRIGWVGGAGIEDHFNDGRFHDMFVRFTGPVVRQFQLVFLASLRWLGGSVPTADLDGLLPELNPGAARVPAVALHNAPGRFRPIASAIADIIRRAEHTLDIANPYVVDRRMIRRIAEAAERGVNVRLFVPANANNWACAGAQHFHHGSLLDAGVRIIAYPTMLHAKAFVADATDVLIGTCNLDAGSLKRFFEIDIRLQSPDLAQQFEQRFAAPAELVSGDGQRLTGTKQRARATALAAISPLL